MLLCLLFAAYFHGDEEHRSTVENRCMKEFTVSLFFKKVWMIGDVCCSLLVIDAEDRRTDGRKMLNEPDVTALMIAKATTDRAKEREDLT